MREGEGKRERKGERGGRGRERRRESSKLRNEPVGS